MGIIEQGEKFGIEKIYLMSTLKTLFLRDAPKRIVLRTVDSISDENGVAIIQEGDAEGKNGEYDNKYVGFFKMKEGKYILLENIIVIYLLLPSYMTIN